LDNSAFISIRQVALPNAGFARGLPSATNDVRHLKQMSIEQRSMIGTHGEVVKTA